ncbi:hypothetical protein B0H11DRAFT_1914983 [Mycena galericulata]|nr:hypothetical protein B0H11DRAFT_1914983 [Mycena galericulata]
MSLNLGTTEHYELATELAKHIGLTTNSFQLMDSQANAVARQNCNFAARFLPSFLAAYKNMPEAGGSFSMLMGPITATSYFSKFIRNQLGSDLYVFHAKKMIKADVFMSNVAHVRKKTAYISDAIITFFHLMLYRHKLEPLSHETHLQVLDWLGHASDNSRMELHTSNLDNLNIHINEESDSILIRIFVHLNDKNTEEHKYTTYLPWKMCGAFNEHPASVGDAVPKQKRRQCGRCKAVTYCSEDFSVSRQNIEDEQSGLLEPAAGL